MQANSDKPKYLGGLYLEAGLNIAVTLTFLNLGVALLIARPGDSLTMIFPIIYLVQCIVFIFYAMCNELVWQRLTVFVLFIISTIAEISVFGWRSYVAYKEIQEDEEKDLQKIMIITGCSFGGWLILRVFTLITLHRFFTELQDGGVEEGVNLHSKLASLSNGRTEVELAADIQRE